MGSKYKVELHYSVKQNDLRIFRRDLFFSRPTHKLESVWEEEEQKLMIKYLSRFMRKPKSDGGIYIEEIIPTGTNCDGFDTFKYEKIKWFSVKNGAVIIRSWYKEKEKYFSMGLSDAYSPELAIKDLMETLEIYW